MCPDKVIRFYVFDHYIIRFEDPIKPLPLTVKVQVERLYITHR